MTLSFAKSVADNPSSYNIEQWEEALTRLYRSQNNQLNSGLSVASRIFATTSEARRNRNKI